MYELSQSSSSAYFALQLAQAIEIVVSPPQTIKSFSLEA